MNLQNQSKEKFQRNEFLAVRPPQTGSKGIFNCCFSNPPISSVETPPDLNPNDYDYIVEKLVIKRVPIALFATPQDLYDYRIKKNASPISDSQRGFSIDPPVNSSLFYTSSTAPVSGFPKSSLSKSLRFTRNGAIFSTHLCYLRLPVTKRKWGVVSGMLLFLTNLRHFIQTWKNLRELRKILVRWMYRRVEDRLPKRYRRSQRQRRNQICITIERGMELWRWMLRTQLNLDLRTKWLLKKFQRETKRNKRLRDDLRDFLLDGRLSIVARLTRPKITITLAMIQTRRTILRVRITP